MGDFAVKDIRYTVLHVPFHERCADAMQVYGPDWSIVELIEVETGGGVVGVGETIQGYTWGRSLEPQFARARGRNISTCCGTTRWGPDCRWRSSTRPASTSTCPAIA